MKLTKKNLKEMIREVIKESYFSPDFSFMRPGKVRDEEEALHKHRMAKRARGEYPKRHSAPIEEPEEPYVPPTPEEKAQKEQEREQQREKAMVQAYRSIAKMASLDSPIMVDPQTFDQIQRNAPDIVDYFVVPQDSRYRRKE